MSSSKFDKKFNSLATDRNECNTSVQEKSLQTDGKVEESVQTFDFQLDYAVAQHKSEAFINVQYGTTFPANGTQLQGATYLERSALPRTNTDVDDNVSQKVIHPRKNDNRDTCKGQESEDRQEIHNIGRGTNEPNEGNHTDDTDKSIIWISKLGRQAYPEA